MTCQRCGGSLERFVLEGREALICTECEYVDSAVAHQRESGHKESWEDAFARFHSRKATALDDGVDIVRVADGD